MTGGSRSPSMFTADRGGREAAAGGGEAEWAAGEGEADRKPCHAPGRGSCCSPFILLEGEQTISTAPTTAFSTKTNWRNFAGEQGCGRGRSLLSPIPGVGLSNDRVPVCVWSPLNDLHLG